MDATRSLCRIPLFLVVLAAVLGCQADNGMKTARGQVPVDPLAPIAPHFPPPAAEPNSPLTPAVPANSMPVIPGKPVEGAPVSPGADKTKIIQTGFTATKNTASMTDLLKKSTPRVKVVAIVGENNVITDQEVRESVWQQNDELARLEGNEREVRLKQLYTIALRRTIERELILDEMYTKLKKANKQTVIEEIREAAMQMTDRRIREIKRRINLKTDEEFAEFLNIQGLTVPVLRRQFEREFMAQQYLNSMFKEKGRRVGLSEIRAYYDKHPEQFQVPDRVSWQHLFISSNKHATLQDAYAHTETLRQKIIAGDDFAEISKRFDNGLAGQQNGMGTGETRGKILPDELETTVWSLAPAQMSNIIQTPTGYHLVKVVEREYAGLRPFDAKVQAAIRDKLTEVLIETETKKLVEELWRKGVVRVLEE